MKGLDLFTVKEDNTTDPEVPMGTPIILIDDGTIDVGKLEFQKEYNSLTIAHPKNEGEIKLKAKALLQKKVPEYLKSKSPITLVCPEELSKEMIF